MTSGARTCHLGIDVGTGSVRAALFDAVDGGLVAEHIEPLTVYRSGSRHELDLEAAWGSIERALAVLDTTLRAPTLRDARPDGRVRVSAIGVSATASTVGALDDELQPIGRAVLWADHRAAAEAEALRQTGHPVLARTLGHVSPEWGLPKLMYLWGRGAAPGSARRGRSRGRHIVELLDFVNLRLTGRLVANAGMREWGWLVADDGRWPQDLVDGLGLSGALQLVPREALVTGAVIGRVRGELEKALPFLRDARVVMGGMDSYMAALGQGVVGTQTLAVSVGSSSSIVAATRTGDARGRLYGPMRRILPGEREGY
jgi:ribulose kinase